MVEPLLLQFLPSDQELDALATQFIEGKGEIYDTFIAACKEVKSS